MKSDTNDQADELKLESERIGKKLKITARLRDEAVHIDTIDPNNANHRERFVKGLAKAVPTVPVEQVDAELLRLADNMNKPSETHAPDDLREVDVSRIIRPEQFITPDVSGLTVPVIVESGGEPIAQWMQYRRWSDGRRECCELDKQIILPDQTRLWLHPIPNAPSIHTALGWSAAARRAWLNGAAAPDPAVLFRNICERIAHFIDMPKEVAAGTVATLAIWSMFTYVYQAWDAVPYLYVGGPKESGKTTLLDVLKRLVFRSLFTSSLKGPTLFRTLHDRGGVLLLDEAEELRKPTPEIRELVAMLNAGYKRGGQATRLVGDTFTPVAFDVYGPKALTCIAGLPSVLASRCITVRMFRADPDSPKLNRRVGAEPQIWRALRDDLHALALEYGPTWLELAGRSDVCAYATGRTFELWQPLLALAWFIESHGAHGLLDLMQAHARISAAASKDDQVPETDEILLEILTEGIRSGLPPTPGEILAKAQLLNPGTFKLWQPKTVSTRLKSYGIARPIKSNGERRYRSVTVDMLRRIQHNYGIDLEIPDPAPIDSTLSDPSGTVESASALAEGGCRDEQGR